MTGLAKIRTLVVEDNPTDALLLKEALAEIPGAVFETTWVERLADALPRLEQTRFDLVFLDLNLPDSDPPNTLARLGCFLPEAPVIVLTGLEIDAMGLKAIEMGAQDYLVKGPFPPGVLGRSIRFALGRHRGAQTLRANEVRQHNARKMESIGLLAGGIAHKFNNILTTVRGNLDLAMDDSGPGWDTAEYLKSAVECVDRAARLTRHLLAYSGKGAFRRSAVSISEAAHDTLRPLRAGVPQNIEIKTDLASNLRPVIMDSRQLELILRNLVMNAIEAIGEDPSGTVFVSTRPCTRFICLTVSDTGCGMDAETRKRIFDPFFTTKLKGHDGLGLAAVDGIVRSLDGHITVESVAGHGTHVQILLPAAEPRAVGKRQSEPQGECIAPPWFWLTAVPDTRQLTSSRELRPDLFFPTRTERCLVEDGQGDLPPLAVEVRD